MKRSIQEAVFRLAPVRWAIACFMLCRGRLLLRSGRLYRGLDDLCWVVRVSRVEPLKRLARPSVFRTAASIGRATRNPLVESFRAEPSAVARASGYSLDGSGPRDLFRDLIVLKRARPDEKGVILLKYARTFDAVAGMFDLSRLMERYIFVLEPCWAGYCHPTTLMYVAQGNPVFVQCFTEEDHQFIVDVGAPLVPVRLGPADWVDADIFRPPLVDSKPYDLVMVANWARHKRHAQLFRALSQIRGRRIRVLLIGFPWAGRTADDIRREAALIRNPLVEIEVVEQVPQSDLADRVSRCKALVFLSRKEGDNKALVEAMFADVPAIVYDQSIGGARSRINPATGILASDGELPAKIVHMLDHYAEFTPRAWVAQHSGSAIATRALNEVIGQTVTQAGGRYTEGIVEKTNSPNLAYKDPSWRARFHSDYEFIRQCRRDSTRAAGKAVA